MLDDLMDFSNLLGEGGGGRFGFNTRVGTVHIYEGEHVSGVKP